MESLIKWLLLVTCAVGTLSFLVIALALRNLRFWCLCALALTYPIGKALQALIIGPQWIRHYLSDFGFVPCMVLAWILALGALHGRQQAPSFKSYFLLPAALTFTGVAVLGEALQWIIGKGDWVDVAAELLSLLATLPLLKNFESIPWDRVYGTSSKT